MHLRSIVTALAVAGIAAAAQAQPTRPRLIVAIAVDQLSADLFSEYRQHFTGGLKRMSGGVVFPSGYQGHAATETCPGHATILTGGRPYRTGIIANDWLDQSIARDDKVVYCAEDETLPGTASRDYVVSSRHLLMPTLGDRMKAANPATRVVAVAGKDRAAVMMGGHKADQLWWWDGKTFSGPKGQTANPAMPPLVAAIGARATQASPAFTPGGICATRSRAIPVGDGKTVGAGRFERKAGDLRAFRASPELDNATIDVAQTLIASMKLGRGEATDLVAIGASVTDYVGHTYGTGGSETCLTLMALDQKLGELFATLDATGVPYVAVLTSDHGGHDLPERNRLHAAPDAQRIDARFDIKVIGAQIGREQRLTGPVLLAQGADIYVERSVPQRRRAKVIQRAVELIRESPMVAEVLVGADLARMPQPSSPPELWSLAERARTSYMAGRSGDLIVALKQRVTPIAKPMDGYVATHGSFWDYDRKVPILFWWNGVQPFEQPLGVETVDIMPTLASLIGLPVPATEIDGECLDIEAGEPTNCPVATAPKAVAAPQPNR